MKKKLFRVKTVISLSCRNECIFLRSQFFYSHFSGFTGKNLFCTLLYSIISTGYQHR